VAWDGAHNQARPDCGALTQAFRSSGLQPDPAALDWTPNCSLDPEERSVLRLFGRPPYARRASTPGRRGNSTRTSVIAGTASREMTS
jgi:hypothetical protein